MPLTLLLLSGLALSANPYLEEGRRLYLRLDYPRAEQTLRLACGVTSGAVEERRQACDLLARALIAQGKRAEGERVYQELLSTDPLAPEPPDASPKIREAYLAAKRTLYPPHQAKLAVAPAPPGELRLDAMDPWSEIVELKLYVRDAAGAFVPRSLPREGRGWRWEAGGASVSSWYAVALDRQGEVVAQVGSPVNPLQVPAAAMAPSPPAAPAAPPSGNRGWLVWTLAGVAVSAAAAGGTFAVLASRDSAAAEASGSAVQTRALDGRAHDRALYANALIAGAVLCGAGAVTVRWVW